MFATIAAPAAPVRIVCLGDSVTKAVREGVAPEQTFCAIVERSLHDPKRPIEVINAGIGGNSTGDGLARLDRDVMSHDPTYVVIMFGLNDSWIEDGKTASLLDVSQYRDNLRRMIAALRMRGITAILMTPNPAIAPKYGPERNVTLKPYVEAVRDLARREHVELVDVYGRFAELAIEGVDLNTLFTDAMHPNLAGQELIAGMLTERFTVLLNAGQK
jgi:lysophospholipase L1-like esterase